MTDEVRTGVLVSDFNIENLAAYLRNDRTEPRVEAAASPFGQVVQTLLDDGLPCWSSHSDFVVVWTRPEAVLETFRDLLAFAEVDPKELLADVDAYAARLIAAKDRARVMFVPTWVVPGVHSGHGMLALAPRVGIARALMQANLRLLENLDAIPTIVPLNAAKWIEAAGPQAFSPRRWYLAKAPFGNDVFKTAASDMKAALRGIRGGDRKVVILDLDDTLWGGIVGDQGWDGITLGGHDPAGEALVDFQRELLALRRRGIVLAIASKNDGAVAVEAIEKHPEMVLTVEDFAAWRINWNDKAANIVEVMEELNLGLDSAVFIDDNPVERARVREALPGVLVPEWPADKRLYPSALRSLDCFDTLAISEEDRHRPEMYVTERKRAALKVEVGSLETWLRTLSMAVTVESLSDANVVRAVQLLNKTNQFNLTTRRVTESELLAWVSEPGRGLWTFRVSDRFGDSGLTGIASVEAEGPRGRIEDFVLSCRVMGRKVEETMLGVAAEWARRIGLVELRAVYRPTAKNKPCLEFFQRSGFRSPAEHVFTWDLAVQYPSCSEIHLVDRTAESTRGLAVGSR